MKDVSKIAVDRFFQPEETISIAIAAPSSVPFVVGGAEKLWWGLQEYINRNTPHHCELIKVCVNDNNFRELIESYDRFYCLDLLHFDLVLTTRYPAWMIRHPNHHVYFQHPLRGLYERYQGPEKLSRNVRAYPGVHKILSIIADSGMEIRRLFDYCMKLAHDPKAPEEALSLQGPLIRQVIHALDHHAIHRANRVSAISSTVWKRNGYFPDPMAVRVIHHPSNLQGLHDLGREYLFTASRMVRSKRIHLLLQSYLESGLDIPLKIAGRGPEFSALRYMVAGNRNVEFTGFVSDRDLAGLYSRALAVVFVPEDEDFGLVTLEAMNAGKPVITCTDSGGSTELVRHGQTGWVCPPDPSALAAAMRESAADFQKTERMGRLACEQVRDISWQNLVSSLFAPAVSRRRLKPAKPLRGASARAAKSCLPLYSCTQTSGWP